jgi:hypothetical protein
MNPTRGACIVAASAICVAFLLTSCNNNTTTPSTGETACTGVVGPDILYVQDSTTKEVRMYADASALNGEGCANSVVPTSDGSNPDVVFSPTYRVLWYPSAYPTQGYSGPQSTPIRIWNSAFVNNGANPNSAAAYTDGQGTATYDSLHDLLYVANVDGPTIQVYANAHLMNSASVPAANITLTIRDGGIAGTPRPAEMLYDPTKDILYVSDYGTVVATFAAFGAAAESAVAGHTSPTIPATRQIIGLFQPRGMAYSPANDILFVGERYPLSGAGQVDVIHGASTASGPNSHGQVMYGFTVGPNGMAYDPLRDFLFIYDPPNIWGVPSPEVGTGAVNNIVNRHEFFDPNVAPGLFGFGLAVDTTH